MGVQPRSLTLVALAVAAASLAGTALASAEWRLGLGALTLAAAGVFGGLLDGRAGDAPAWAAKASPAALRRTILVLGMLTYLVIVPVLGFMTRSLEELGAAPGRWWLFAGFGVTELLVAFVVARRWRRERVERVERVERAPGPTSVAAVTR